MQIADLPQAKVSAARRRVLETAARLFYAEGINSVGVSRIVKEAGVTLATFYRHFPSKQDLVLAYLQRVHDDFAQRAAEAHETSRDPEDMLRAIGHNITAQLTAPGYRGCAFINASSEFEDLHGPVLRAVLAHRAWFLALVRDTFAAAGHPDPDAAASLYVMLRDGATTAGHLGDPSLARDTFDRGVSGLFDFTDGNTEGEGVPGETPRKARRRRTRTTSRG